MINAAIIAHPSRKEDAEELAKQIPDAYMAWDTEGYGCEATHSKALSYLMMTTGTLKRTEGKGHFLVLEDDALIREDFLDQLDQVIAVAPADIIGLYLGTGYPTQWQPTLRRVMSPVDADPNFLVLSEMLNMVGYVVRAELAAPIAEALWRDRHVKCSDRIVTDLVRERELRVAYCRPSIVDHRQDIDPVITKRHDGQDRSKTRRAWRYGGRKQWQNSAMAATAPKPVRVDEQGEWYEIEGGGTFNVS